ncbi:hypothetical protein QUG64_03220 [Acinetobacter lwoffii]|uniref:EF-hand domain-containing protein n=1 Tax=Acinetobacter lwoffii NCTC 5866 = CIP 64.10 = NIPH 512 TaxID=981327 RepID=A0ABN0PZX4_ACILW|nr:MULTISPECIES: hypothetical protein [Acinetobacter]ENU16681.1 hypothetical protein F995_02166 [Acinetobacter sp. CIP A162]ESJ96036.1 hypothetical protein P800_00858 [Acinetobacter lwoffii NCTC 5866 = CIP 64.10 = NIPH 512]QXB40450.1 hypothetical protein I6L23_14960 [Acinetobacter lwoffii]SUU30302.1 Uncharacterised protein [Acinetobacter lwoffii]VFQ38461.1 Uncharacterised protein [Acinetobacter lwoffii]
MSTVQLMNQIIEKLNRAADLNQELTLSKEEVIELREELGDSVYIPVLSMEEMAQFSKDQKTK